MARQLLFNCSHAMTDVPDPENGSSTVPVVQFAISILIQSIGLL